MGEVPRPYFQSSDVTIWHADAREAWQWLPEHSVNAVITSPPYYGLRDYGVEGQIGLEDDPQTYVDNLADLLTGYGERVLRADGSLWLNLGDTYSGSWGNYGATAEVGSRPKRQHLDVRHGTGRPPMASTTFPNKCLLMIPERVALALIARGWILRNKIVWAKPNGMPESVRDRLATKWEHLFHLVRQPRYHYDLDAIREPHASPLHAPGNKRRVPMTNHFDEPGRVWGDSAGKNPGDVWTIPTQAFPDAHFATFPGELVRRPILATVPEQVCRECGQPRERVMEQGPLVPTVPGTNPSTTGHAGLRAGDTQAAMAARDFATGRGNSMPRREREQVGWTDCGCEAGWQPGVVLDPFFGSGTTAHMARRLGRRAWGVELNADYCQMAADRFRQETLFGGLADP